MNADTPKTPGEELESRITAMLLGELPEAESTELRRAIAQDTELGRRHDRLKRAIALLEEALHSPAQENPETLRLAPERREQVMQSFKVLRPVELRLPSRKRTDFRTWGALAAMILGLLAILSLIPGIGRTRFASRDSRKLELMADLRDLAGLEEKSPQSGAVNRPSVEAPPIASAGQPVAAATVQKDDANGRPQSVYLFGTQPLETPAQNRPPRQTIEDKPVAGGGGGGGSAFALNGVSETKNEGLEAPKGRGTRTLGLQSEVQLKEEAPIYSGLDYYRMDPILGKRFGLIPQPSEGKKDGKDIASATQGRGLASQSQPSAVTDLKLVERDLSNSERENLSSTVVSGLAAQPLLIARPKLSEPAPSQDAKEIGQSRGDNASNLQMGRAVGNSSITRGFVGGSYGGGGTVVLNSGTASRDEGLELPKNSEGRKPAQQLGDLPALGMTLNYQRQLSTAAASDFGVAQSKSKPAAVAFDILTSAAPQNQPESRVAALANDRETRSLERETSPAQNKNESPQPTQFDKLAEAKQSLTVSGKPVEPAQNLKLDRQLTTLNKIHDSIELRILQENVDVAQPKRTVVEIVDLATAQTPAGPGKWERFRTALGGEVERSARISVAKNTTDIAPLLQIQKPGYDPYFIKTELERIRSRSVLEKVIEKLHLNETWGKKEGAGKTLGAAETYQRLVNMVDVRQNDSNGQNDPNGLLDITVHSPQPEEAARIANTIAKTYRETRLQVKQDQAKAGVNALQKELAKTEEEIANAKSELDRQKETAQTAEPDIRRPKPSPSAPIPQPEVAVTDNAFSTFSLNVSDVSFKLAGASLGAGQMPDPVTVRSEEFVNAFDYRDPEPQGSAPIAFAWERAHYPFAHDRDLLRLSLKTGAAGRESGRPLNIVLLLDNSGSMERADRVQIIQECIRVLAAQLQPQDRVSVVAFARTARLWVDALPGNQAGELPARVGNLTPQGGTNLEEAMKLAYQTALRHYLPEGVNRVVLLTDGAANLGDVQPESLKRIVENHRRQGVAFDCFGIGWEGLNDDLLETLSRNGDGRYGFVNTPEEATTGFAGQLAGALQVAASDVKVQVEFNPRRTTAYRQIGYAKHQLTKEQFRDNTVDAAELGAAEAGNALYIVRVNSGGEGPLAIVRVRFKIPGTEDYREHEWPVPYDGLAKPFEQASAALRLAGTAAAFSEWLVASPYAAEVTPDRLLQFLSGAPENWPADPRPKKLESMIRQANSLQGKR